MDMRRTSGRTPQIIAARSPFWRSRMSESQGRKLDTPDDTLATRNLGANGANPRLRTFTLILEDAGGNEQGRVDFRGTDTHQAFVLLERETRAKRASLWEGGKRLGTLELTSDAFWELSH